MKPDNFDVVVNLVSLGPRRKPGASPFAGIVRRCVALYQLILLAMNFSNFAISAANLRMPSAVFSVAIASSFRR
jgi:hypothetical protein